MEDVHESSRTFLISTGLCLLGYSRGTVVSRLREASTPYVGHIPASFTQTPVWACVCCCVTFYVFSMSYKGRGHTRYQHNHSPLKQPTAPEGPLLSPRKTPVWGVRMPRGFSMYSLWRRMDTSRTRNQHNHSPEGPVPSPWAYQCYGSSYVVVVFFLNSCKTP